MRHNAGRHFEFAVVTVLLQQLHYDSSRRRHSRRRWNDFDSDADSSALMILTMCADFDSGRARWQERMRQMEDRRRRPSCRHTPRCL